MAKDSYTKALEKQNKERKKEAEAAARRERAKSVIDGQPIIAGFRVMDKDSEQLFDIILEKYSENDERFVSLSFEDFPKHMQFSVNFELEKLKMYGVISNYLNYMSGCNINISSSGLEYFEKKKSAEAKEKVLLQTSQKTHKQYDVFLSHANADKLSYVDDLYTALSKLKINIFYDKEELSWGDNWKDKILEGTEKSEFAIIVISKAFFGREWTERELNEFLQKQNESGQKVILPLLYDISFDDVKEHYPELEYIQSIKVSEHTTDDITILFAKELIKRFKAI